MEIVCSIVRGVKILEKSVNEIVGDKNLIEENEGEKIGSRQKKIRFHPNQTKEKQYFLFFFFYPFPTKNPCNRSHP